MLFLSWQSSPRLSKITTPQKCMRWLQVHYGPRVTGVDPTVNKLLLTILPFCLSGRYRTFYISLGNLELSPLRVKFSMMVTFWPMPDSSNLHIRWNFILPNIPNFSHIVWKCTFNPNGGNFILKSIIPDNFASAKPQKLITNETHAKNATI